MSDQVEVRVPDIGDFENVEVVEVLVARGDRVNVEDSLVSLESDKATMEVPSPVAGEVLKVRVALGDKVSEGSLLFVLRRDVAAAGAEPAAAAPTAAEGAAAEPPTVRRPGEPTGPRRPPVPPERPRASGDAPAHASPLVRGYARQLGVDLGGTTGSGPHGRILIEDVRAHVREAMGGGGGSAIPTVAEVDYARFGAVEERPLGRIQRVSADRLKRSWLNVPHVTQHDEADVTDLEAVRRSRADAAAERGVKLSPLLFVMKAVAVALREQPVFRSSLSPDGERLVVKHYVHLGIAVDTEEGLIVPVVRDVDRKGIWQLAQEVAELAERARTRKLAPADLQGACFTLSSLGGIGGSAFTPIVNAPEVAILGLSRLVVRPVWTAGLDVSESSGGVFRPRVLLPLSLSYDHRVIDGAVAVRFTTRLSQLLSEPVSLLL